MESLEKIKIKKLKETIIQGHEKDFKIVLTQLKESYKGIRVYKIYSELKHNGELFDMIDFHITYNKQKSDRYFNILETRYPEVKITRKIF